jgi:hypothetical protein
MRHMTAAVRIKRTTAALLTSSLISIAAPAVSQASSSHHAHHLRPAAGQAVSHIRNLTAPYTRAVTASSIG